MKSKPLFFVFFVLFSALTTATIQAQSTDSLRIARLADSQKNTKIIQLVKSDSLLGVKNDEAYYNRLIGNVVLMHQGSTLTCDSAHLFTEKNYVEAFGNVIITASSGAICNAQYLRFNGNTNIAFLKDNVSLEDGENTINTEELTYNIKTKYATYAKGGTFQNGNTVLTSNSGNYNGFSKDAYFKGDVVVTDPKYDVYGDELKYNTETKIVRFTKETTIATENATITGRKGYYDSKKELGEFNVRSSAISDDRQISANYMNYNKAKGLSLAKGDVIINDYKNNRNLYCDRFDYNETDKVMWAKGKVYLEDLADHRNLKADLVHYKEKSKYTHAQGDVALYDSAQKSTLLAVDVYFNSRYNTMLAVGNPLLKSLLDKDSLFVRADTFFSAPQLVMDTLKQIFVQDLADTNFNEEQADSNIKRKLLAFHHVQIFMDSMQAICDSLCYSEADSLYTLFKDPVLWYNKMQAKGDTVSIQTANSKISRIDLLKQSSMISEADSSNQFYDQIYANEIHAFFDSSELRRVEAIDSVRSLYFSKNDKQEYVGLNQAASQRMGLDMAQKEISKIVFYQDPSGKVIPMKDLNEGNKKLSDFVWLIQKKPKNKYALLNRSASAK